MRCTQPPTGQAARVAARHAAALPVLETPRLRLRAPEMGDLPVWTAILADWPDGPVSPEDAWADFAVYTAAWLLHGHGLWTVTTRAGEVLGFVMVGLEWGDAEPELGYMFRPEARGQGYATEAAAAARDHGMQLLGTLVSYVDPANVASNALAARLGATRDAAAEAALAEPVHVWRYRSAAA
ncbi:GNAT family N-acetyltransferase [Jannaschia marina]|uniref:GNAT family N-acetyltransferase n=1 Tax=Jannaschia marina TaxID=2741674 RepID=UPI0015C988EC|nr:GNAT family N-acetyltransferase [Jannaschia marina]